MTPAAALASLRAQLARHGQDVLVRRYSGTGPARTKVDAQVRARLRGAGSSELVGSIVQGKFTAIVIADPDAVVPGGMVPLTDLLPIRPDDRLVVGGAEKAIEAVDDQSRRIDGVLIGLNLQVAG